MERGPSEPTYISPSLRYAEQWEAALSDEDLAARLEALVDLTQSTVDPVENPWVQDRNEVAGRWQHAVESLGGIAATHSHPLLNGGWGWADKERVAQVLEPVEYRSFDASLVENALLLTHSLALQQHASDNPGLSVNLVTLNNMHSMQDPELVEHFTVTVDLRDMAEPVDTVLGNMTFEQYQALDPSEQGSLADRLSQIAKDRERFGKGYGWDTPPQESRYFDEALLLSEYMKRAEYGTTDEDEITKIRHQRKADEIASLRAERPDFGKLPEGYKEMPKHLRLCVGAIIQYFDQMRAPADEITIDTYSLGEMEFTEKDLTELIAAGVLEENGSFPSPSGILRSFKLSPPYYERWLIRHFPTPKHG